MISRKIKITPEQERLINNNKSIDILMSPAPLIDSTVTLKGMNGTYTGYINAYKNTETGLFCNISL